MRGYVVRWGQGKVTLIFLTSAIELVRELRVEGDKATIDTSDGSPFTPEEVAELKAAGI